MFISVHMYNKLSVCSYVRCPIDPYMVKDATQWSPEGWLVLHLYMMTDGDSVHRWLGCHLAVVLNMFKMLVWTFVVTRFSGDWVTSSTRFGHGMEWLCLWLNGVPLAGGFEHGTLFEDDKAVIYLRVCSWVTREPYTGVFETWKSWLCGFSWPEMRLLCCVWSDNIM